MGRAETDDCPATVHEAESGEARGLRDGTAARPAEAGRAAREARRVSGA